MDEMKYSMNTNLLDDLYKNVRMGTFAIDCIITEIKNKELEKLLRKQNKVYLEETKLIEAKCEELKHKPSDINLMLKGSSFASIKMKSMMDKTTSHLAQMLVEGTTMGITTSLKAKTDNSGAEKEVLEMSNRIIGSQEKFVEGLKDFI